MVNAASFADLSDFVLDDDDVVRDTWHVLMAPNEVRVLSLEQLDDTYRLGIIDERTLVWRPSLVEWTELQQVIDDSEPAHDPEVWHALVAPNRVVDGTLDQLDHAYQIGAIDERTLVWRTGLPGWMPLGIVAGIEAAPRTATPASATTPSALPRLVPASSVPHSAPSSAIPNVIPSVAPVAFSLPPPVGSKGKAERWLFGAALIAATALVLYRNDLVYQAAVAAGQAPYVERAEQRAFGGPVFGTSRSVDELIREQHIDHSRITIPVMLADQQRAAEREAEAERLRQAQADAAALAKRKADEAELARKQAAEAVAAQKKADEKRAEESERVRSALGGKSAPVHAAPAPHKTKKDASGETEVIPGVKASKRRGSEYDPLNPTL